MKRKISLICLLLCCLFSIEAHAQTQSVSKSDALTIVQRQFQGRDVDYLIRQDSNATSWTIFVDAEPMKGWEHECYILTVPKNITTSVDDAVPSSKVQRKLPPSGNYVPLSVKNRYGNAANSKPVVQKNILSNDSRTAAERTYAIILSGGISKMSNYEWKDNNGNSLGKGSSITVSPTAINTKYTVTATNEEGEIAEESISLDPVNGIKYASLVSGYINVSLLEEASDNSRITISSIVNGTVVASGTLAKGETEISINVSHCNDGVYIVTYLVNDTVVDSRKITVEK